MLNVSRCTNFKQNLLTCTKNQKMATAALVMAVVLLLFGLLLQQSSLGGPRTSPFIRAVFVLSSLSFFIISYCAFSKLKA